MHRCSPSILLFLPLAGLLLLASTTGSAETRIFRCEDDQGNTIFSQQPCGADAKETTVRSPNSTAPVTGNESTWDKVAAGNEVRELERQIQRIEKRIVELQSARDIDVSRLREYGDNSNTPPGLSYEQGLKPKIEALQAQYQSKIEAEQSRINALRARIRELQRS